MTNSIAYNIYSTSVNLAKRCMTPSRIDRIEKGLASLAIGVATVSALVISAICLPVTPPDLPCLPEDKPSNLPLIAIGIAAPIILYAANKGSQMLDAMNKRLAEKLFPYKNRLIDEEIERFTEASKIHEKIALVFRPAQDKTGSLLLHTEIPSLQKSTKDHAVSLIAGTSKAQMDERMAQDLNKYDKIIFRSHANSDRLALGHQVLLKKTAKKTLQWVSDHAKDGAIISIEGCLAGKGEENIARDISRACPHATVYASHGVVQPDEIAYDKDGIPSFNCLGLDTTRIYQNGKLLSPPIENQELFDILESLHPTEPN
jgi:hypothetical protein